MTGIRPPALGFKADCLSDPGLHRLSLSAGAGLAFEFERALPLHGGKVWVAFSWHGSPELVSGRFIWEDAQDMLSASQLHHEAIFSDVACVIHRLAAKA